jgi:hypothetical protein
MLTVDDTTVPTVQVELDAGAVKIAATGVTSGDAESFFLLHDVTAHTRIAIANIFLIFL